MPRQNRVTPTGQIVAHPGRGMFMGNRGCLHDDAGNLARTHTSQKAWVTCALEFKGRKRQLMRPGCYTELFFLDEAVALAAGHRPCAECRRSCYNQFADSWAAAFGRSRPRAPEMDVELSRDRLDRTTRQQVTHRAVVGDLPDGVFVRVGEPEPFLYWRGALYPYALDRYGPTSQVSYDSEVEVLTPRATVGVLRAGYEPVVHQSIDSVALEALEEATGDHPPNTV